jgi:hypothetical protein
MTHWDRRPWENWLGNVVIEHPERHYYPTKLADLLEIISDAERETPPRKVRASGSHWALSDPAVSPDWFVETNGLTKTLDHVIPAALSNLAHNSGNTYHHVESGISLRDLSLRLDSGPGQKWALPTMGGAAGQTLAGAISTGTHGSDHQLPPIADTVEAIHLVTTKGRQLWIERDEGITDRGALMAALPDVESHYSTAMFNASLVAVGRMGIIYSLVVRVVEQFSLDQIIIRSTWDQVESRVRSPFPVFSTPPPGHTGSDPQLTHFVEVVVLPYARRDGRHSAYVTLRWKGPDDSRPQPPRKNLFARICSHRVLIPWPWRITIGGLVAAACNLANRLGLSWLVRELGERLIRQFRSQERKRDVGYNIMDLGRTTGDCYRGDSIEVAFDAVTGDHVAFLHDEIFPTFERFASKGMTVGGYISLRFTQRSAALLAMQRWDTTCSIEIALLDGVRGNAPILDALQAAAVRRGGTVHWGQRNTLTSDSVEQAFPSLSEWRLELSRIVGSPGGEMFDNKYCQNRGLEPLLPT